jgi:hypothetical protein
MTNLDTRIVIPLVPSSYDCLSGVEKTSENGMNSGRQFVGEKGKAVGFGRSRNVAVALE